MRIRTNCQVRITVGNTCGSGTIVYQDSSRCLILSNAHVNGTVIGRMVNVHSFFHASLGEQTRQGRVIFAAMRSGTNIDLAIVECPPIDDAVAVPINKDGRCDRLHGQTGGSPRCELTKFSQIHYNTQGLLAVVQYWLPNAIGGQSGSGVLDYTGSRLESLLTWSNGTYGMGQNSQSVYRVLTERNLDMATQLPTDARIACDNPQQTSDGVHGETADFPPGMFTTCNSTPDPDPDPDPDPSTDMAKITVLAKSILAISEGNETGFDWSSIDWSKIIAIILQLVLDSLKDSE